MKLLASLLLCAGPVSAQVTFAAPAQCGPHEAIVAWLHQTYQEKQMFIGLSASGLVTELWWSQDHETWTWIQTNAYGSTCILHHGTDGDGYRFMGEQS